MDGWKTAPWRISLSSLDNPVEMILAVTGLIIIHDIHEDVTRLIVR
jgi:hypothetical protein